MSFGGKNKKPEPLYIEYLLGASSSGGAAMSMFLLLFDCEI